MDWRDHFGLLDQVWARGGLAFRYFIVLILMKLRKLGLPLEVSIFRIREPAPFQRLIDLGRVSVTYSPARHPVLVPGHWVRLDRARWEVRWRPHLVEVENRWSVVLKAGGLQVDCWLDRDLLDALLVWITAQNRCAHAAALVNRAFHLVVDLLHVGVLVGYRTGDADQVVVKVLILRLDLWNRHCELIILIVQIALPFYGVVWVDIHFISFFVVSELREIVAPWFSLNSWVGWFLSYLGNSFLLFMNDSVSIDRLNGSWWSWIQEVVWVLLYDSKFTLDNWLVPTLPIKSLLCALNTQVVVIVRSCLEYRLLFCVLWSRFGGGEVIGAKFEVNPFALLFLLILVFLFIILILETSINWWLDFLIFLIVICTPLLQFSHMANRIISFSLF